MSEEEFAMEVQKDRQKLVILDDLVLDVTSFAGSHPGGRFLIERNIGRDISKYFHGGYSFEPMSGSKNHTHSNYARTIVNNLIVARFVAKRETAVMSVQTRVQAVAQEDSSVKTFTMQALGQTSDMQTKFCNFYPDLD